MEFRAKCFISIIIANYNSEKWIRQCLNSILEQKIQTNKYYEEMLEVIIVDDMSTDNSPQIIKNYSDRNGIIREILQHEKRWNGGSRNVGLKYAQGEYVLFMDDDDWFNNNECIKDMLNTIIENNFPDVLRLPYRNFSHGKKQNPIMLADNNPKDLVNSTFVAPWTKLVKTKKVVKFPENTLIEDVVQHIAQCDVIETVGVCKVPIICWNRDNMDSTSLARNLHKHNSKRVSSVYRNIADLMDLQCTHDYCEAHRKWRVEAYKNIVRQGKEEEIW